jgi:hypothetical protein
MSSVLTLVLTVEFAHLVAGTAGAHIVVLGLPNRG